MNDLEFYKQQMDRDDLEFYKQMYRKERAETERLRAVLKGVEIALARDGDIDGAMGLILSQQIRTEDGRT
jgi:hypothetical protein